MATKLRAIEAATVAFADRGVAGTSLDGLAAELGVTKQTILYHFGSKDGLLEAVLTEAARDLVDTLLGAIEADDHEWERVVNVVRASFELAIRRPDLLGLLREVNRLGRPWSEVVLDVVQPLVEGALGFLDDGMREGRFRAGDPQMVLLSAYAVVTGVVSDAEALRAVGLDLDLRVAARLRRSLLSFLEAALVAPSIGSDGGCSGPLT